MPSLLTYRQGSGRSIDDWAFYLATSGTGSTVVLGDLINALSNASVKRYDDVFAFNQTKILQRRVRNSGYAPSTGTLTVDPTWTAPAASDVIELTRLFPCLEPVNGYDGPSYRALINRALSMFVLPDRITLTIVPGQQVYSLATYAYWLDRQERFGWVNPELPDGPRLIMTEPGPGGMMPIPADWRRPKLVIDGATPHLEIAAPFTTGATGSLTLNVMRTGDSLVNGAEGAGLTLDADTALPASTDVIEVVKLLAYETLDARSESSAVGTWADKIPAQRAIVENLRYIDRSRLATTAQAQAA